jgi:hypothetical protein
MSGVSKASDFIFSIFFNSEIYFCRSFILFTSLVLIRGVTSTRIAQLYSGFGPCRFWVLNCWRMPNAPGFWHSAHSLTRLIIQALSVSDSPWQGTADALLSLAAFKPTEGGENLRRKGLELSVELTNERSVKSQGRWACANNLTPKTGTGQIRNATALFWYSCPLGWVPD